MTRRFVLAGRVCAFLLTVAALASSPTLNALPLPNAVDSAGKHDATASNSPVFLVAPSISVAGRPAAMVVGDLNGDGAPDLVVANAQTGNVDVLLGDGKGKFQAPVHYKVGGSPAALVLADLAGHGKIDIAVANQIGNSVSVLLGKGDGTFQTAATYTVGSGPASLVVGDFDGDGHADLLIANAGSNTLAVLTNKGDGRFQSARFYAVAASPRAIAVADFNGDGKLDVASGNDDGTVSILLGDGTGRFNVAATMTSATRVSALVVGDFNRDGKSDLAVADSVASTVRVFLGRGDGTFQSSSVLSVGNEPVSLALEDVNADDMLDLLAVNKSGNTVSVMLGAGDGTFQPSAEYVVGNSPVAVAIADFNGDGHLDLATANSADGTVTVPLGNGDGTFQAAQDYRTHLERKSVAVGDLDGDGHPDVMVASFCGSDLKCGGNGTASVFLSNGKGALKPASIYALGKGAISIALADVNGDKKLDLIAVNRDDSTVMVLLGNGDGTFQEGIAYPAGSTPVSVSVGDFNKDGKPDLAIAALCGSEGCNQRGSVNILLGNGDGSFKSGSSYDVGFSPATVTVGDVDGDGKLDLVVANSCGKSAACSNGTASVLIGDGKGSFTLKTEIDLGKRVSSVALGDLNQDGKLDLIAANGGDNQVGILLGNGDGTFSRQVPYAVGVVPSAVVVADFDGDGRIDVAVANSRSSTVSLLRGNGDGTLQVADAYAVGLGPEALATLDLDGSGRLAVVTANGNSGGSPLGNDITVLANAGQRPAVTSTTTTVASSLNPSVFGQSVTFTATVSPVPDGGTVDFTSSATPLCSGVAVSVVTGKATCAYSALPVGSDPIKAVYSGDTNFGTSTGTLSPNQTVNKANSATAVSSSVNPSVFGEPVIFSATVSAVAPGSGTPTGQVQLVIDGANVGTPVTLAGGSASFPSISTLSIGAHTVAVKYLGDSNFATSTGNLPTQTVGKAASATAVSSSVNPSVFGQAVTFSATVSAVAPGVGTPTGQVQLVIDGANVGTPVALVAGSASFPSISTLSVGAHTVAVKYLGDSNFATSTGNLPTQTVNKASTKTTPGSTPNPSVFNQAVTFTATVSAVAPVAGTPTGTVTFTFGGALLCTGTLSGGTTSCLYASGLNLLPAGSDTVTATYNGDINFLTSNNTITQTVTKATTTTAVVSSLNPSFVNQSVTFTATVTGQYGGTPTGTVTFTAGTTTLCSAVGLTVVAGVSTATCTYADFGAATYTVTASYNGDSNFLTSSGTVMQVVKPTATTTTFCTMQSCNSLGITASVVSSTLNFTFAATVTPAFTGFWSPAGETITFVDTSTGTVYGPSTPLTLNQQGLLEATFVLTTELSTGNHLITAVYSGDANFLGSTSAAASFYFETPADSQNVISGQPSGGVSLTPTGATGGTTVTFSCLAVSGTGITGFLAPDPAGYFSYPSGSTNGTPATPFVSCWFTPPLNPTAPAGTTITICTALPAPANCTTGLMVGAVRPNLELRPRLPLYSLALFLPGIAFLGAAVPFAIGSRNGKFRRRRLIGFMGLLLGASLLLLLPACGGGFSGLVQPPTPGSGSTPAGTYTVTVQSVDPTDGSVQIYTVPFTVIPPG
jgi:hypothetical protein